MILSKVWIFDLEELLALIKMVNPNFVSVGANTSSVELPEPTDADIHKLIKGLKEFTYVILKDDIKKLYSGRSET